MNNAVKTTLAFILGAAAGAAVAYKALKTKYERKAQEDIDAYRAYADERISAARGETKTEEAPEEATDESDGEDDPMAPLSNLVGRYRSDDYRKEESNIVNEPYIIAPEDYGTRDGFECTSLTYYADGVLADEWDNVIEDPDSLVGEDFEEHFGEYEQDSVFVRNDGLKRDFEILRDYDTYADVVGTTETTPHDTEE